MYITCHNLQYCNTKFDSIYPLAIFKFHPCSFLLKSRNARLFGMGKNYDALTARKHIEKNMPIIKRK
jgi:hypothetical protein